MYQINPSNVMVDPKELNKVYRSLFDLSHEVKGDGDMGKLYPILYEDSLPGDVFNIKNNFVIRFNPSVGLLFHQINVKIYYFFVPYRLVWDEWETFITRGKSGMEIKQIPLWTPTQQTIQKGKLWDALGLPLVLITNNDSKPHALVKRAYNLVWNTWFRDVDLQNEVGLDQNEDLLHKNWDKDYFTSARPSLQRGIPPAIPLIGNVPLNMLTLNNVSSNTDIYNSLYNTMGNGVFFGYNKGYLPGFGMYFYNSGIFRHDGTVMNTNSNIVNDTLNTIFSVNISNVTAGTVRDLRTVIQLQVWMERNQRAGYRYVDFLKAHFNVAPRDDRLQLPEFLGGFSDIITTSEVNDTSGNGSSPLGRPATLAQGIMFSNDDITYRVQEHGLLLGLMVVYPRSQYIQGIPRYFLKRSTFDWYFPEMALVGDQEIYNAEIFVQNNNQDRLPFGYQGRYDEYRYREGRIIGNLRDTFSYMHLARTFNHMPVLNGNFIKCVPRKDFLAVPSEPTFFFAVGNIVKAWRPIPFHSVPAGIFRLTEEDFGVGGSSQQTTNLRESMDNT
jgi:hypothetical protein